MSGRGDETIGYNGFFDVRLLRRGPGGTRGDGSLYWSLVTAQSPDLMTRSLRSGDMDAVLKDWLRVALKDWLRVARTTSILTEARGVA